MSTILRLTRKSKFVLAAIVAVVAFSGVYGFAASLGISSGGLGAGNQIVASCGSGLTLAYTTTFSSAVPGYAVNGINLTNIPSGCWNKNIAVTFTDSSNNPVGSEVTGTLPGSGTTSSISITPSSNEIDASKVTGVSVVVS
jgi:hypothetical protein